MKPLFVWVFAALLLGSESWGGAPQAPLVGFSFSPLSSIESGRDPVQDLDELVAQTQPDLVRLPIYWELVEPTPNELDFSSVDPLLAVIADHNASSPVQTKVVLTIGARNFLYPELHQPAWAGARSQPDIDLAQSGDAYRTYFDASILRYGSSPLLYAWQVENEPLDNVLNDLTGADQISIQQLAWEVGEVHRLDHKHKAVLSSYDGVNPVLDMMQVFTPPLLWPVGGGTGHPDQALAMADALGLDLYVDGPSVPYRSVTSVGIRSAWKAQALAFWADRAHAQGKDFWVAEMQAQPWDDAGDFGPEEMIKEAVDYRQAPVDVVLMWGVETWLWDPQWMAAGVRAIGILRS